MLFGRLDWWPRVARRRGQLDLGALARAQRQIEGRPAQRPSRFADAGMTLLRTSARAIPEIWCRCDGGPHGYLSIAAHAHADALSVEVRYAGVDILADPGTYCYHGEPAWRSYFRSTIAHNTVELGGRSQSSEGGPFLWLRHAHAREIEVIDDGDIASWTAEHDGYASLDPPALHRRSVLLDRASRSIDIVDEIDGGSYDIRLAFHLGPDVQAELDGSCAVLSWPGASAPAERRGWNCRQGCDWSLHRGETDPILGWYAHGLGRRVPAFTLLGRGRCEPGMPADHAAGVRRSQQIGRRCRFSSTPYHGPDPAPGRVGRRRSNGGQMSQQALDLRRSLQIVRRHKVLVGVAGGPGHPRRRLLTPCSTRRCSPAPRWSCFRKSAQSTQTSNTTGTDQ